MNSWMCEDPTRKALLERIEDLGRCCANLDSIDADHVAGNLGVGIPAYWYRGDRTGAASVVRLSHSAEHNFSFLKALEAFHARHPAYGVLEVLDGVIPLNAAAIDELTLCYRLQSTFRDDLAGRERQAIYDPHYQRHMSDEMREVWRERYGECQRRFEERQRDAHWSRPVTSPRHLDAVALAQGAV